MWALLHVLGPVCIDPTYTELKLRRNAYSISPQGFLFPSIELADSWHGRSFSNADVFSLLHLFPLFCSFCCPKQASPERALSGQESGKRTWNGEVLSVSCRRTERERSGSRLCECRAFSSAGPHPGATQDGLPELHPEEQALTQAAAQAPSGHSPALGRVRVCVCAHVRA